MPMPPNQTSQNSRWWSNWFFTHGKDTEKEAAFQGYLSTRHLHAFALTPEELDAAWAGFQAYLVTSEAQI